MAKEDVKGARVAKWTEHKPGSKLPPVEQSLVSAARAAGALTALQGASPELVERVKEIADNLESMEDFQLPRARMTSEGFELVDGDDPVTELDGVIVHTRKVNVYYKDAYNPDEATPPTCASSDGIAPDSGTELQHPTCKGCPMAEFGTNSMKSGKACRNLKPLYLLLSDEAIMPRQVTVTPASLKVANQYLMDLTERGISYRKVKTKITAYKKDRKDTFMTLKFAKGDALSDVQKSDTEALRQYWLPIMNAQRTEPVITDRVAAEGKDSGEY